MSYYVKRSTDYGHGFTGPIRSKVQAGREAASWRGAGHTAEVLESSPEVRAQVRAWELRKRETPKDRSYRVQREIAVGSRVEIASAAHYHRPIEVGERGIVTEYINRGFDGIWAVVNISGERVLVSADHLKAAA